MITKQGDFMKTNELLKKLFKLEIIIEKFNLRRVKSIKFNGRTNYMYLLRGLAKLQISSEILKITDIP